MSSTLSHHADQGPTLEERVAAIENRLRSAERLILPLEEELEILAVLQEFPLGRFLLRNQGLNGYWTAYIFRHVPGTPVDQPMERWLLERSLLAGARERFHRFARLIDEMIVDDAVLASVPCGLMDDLLQRDYDGRSGVRLVGIDIDEESLGECSKFVLADAWKLRIQDEFDLIVSNGLNMYEPDGARLVELYRAFGRALRPGGRLLISFLTPPPPPPWEDRSRADEWDKYGIAEEDLRRELALFGDIIQARYLNFSSEAEIRAQLEQAGLVVDAVHYSDGGVLPIASAIKSR